VVARTASRATSEANPIWGGVYASKGGVHVSAPFLPATGMTKKTGHLGPIGPPHEMRTNRLLSRFLLYLLHT